MKPTLLLTLLFTPLALLGCPGGEECSDTKPCSGVQSCVDHRCVADGACKESNPPAGPANLLDNPGFECGSPPNHWRAESGAVVTSESAGAKGGSRFARLSAPDGGAAPSLWYDGDAVASPGTKTYCARAWMRGTASAGHLSVGRVGPGTIDYDKFSSPLTSTWTLVPPADYGAMTVTTHDETKLLLRAHLQNPAPGSYVEVDDVQLWVSTDGGCKDR